MTKAQKKQLAGIINQITKPLGGIFRWRTQYDYNHPALYWPEKKTIVLAWTAGPISLAHELAHLSQHILMGKTHCSGALGMEHWRHQQAWQRKLRMNGVHKLYSDILA